MNATSPKMIVALLVPALLVGCDKPTASNGGGESSAAQSADAGGLPSDVFLSAAPAGARGVGEVKADPNVAGAVVVHGRIGGRPKPFVDNAAVFVIADAKLKDCIQRHGEGGCPMPWDYCCEPKDSLLANTATVRIVGDDGRPLRVGVQGRGGLEPLVDVTVVGEVQPRASADVLVIDARQVYVAPASQS